MLSTSSNSRLPTGWRSQFRGLAEIENWQRSLTNAVPFTAFRMTCTTNCHVYPPHDLSPHLKWPCLQCSGHEAMQNLWSHLLGNESVPSRWTWEDEIGLQEIVAWDTDLFNHSSTLFQRSKVLQVHSWQFQVSGCLILFLQTHARQLKLFAHWWQNQLNRPQAYATEKYNGYLQGMSLQWVTQGLTLHWVHEKI